MTKTRAWQTVELVPERGHQIVHFLELDLACDATGQIPDIRYVPFTVQEPSKIMATHAAAWSQYGAQAPNYRSVLVIRQGDHPQHFRTRYPGFSLPQHERATIVSADAAEVALITKSAGDGCLIIQNKRPVMEASNADNKLMQIVLTRLWQESRILYFPSGKTDVLHSNRPAPPTIDLIAPLSSNAGHLSFQAHKFQALAAFNAGFFISTEDEFNDPYSFASSPVGLVIVNRRVISAPLFSRSALIFTSNVYQRQEDNKAHALGSLRALIRQVSLANYAVKLPGNVVVHGPLYPSTGTMMFDKFENEFLAAELNPSEPTTSSAIFYNRLIGLSQGEITALYTPPARDRFDLLITGEQICAVKDNGEMFISRNGFVISLPNNHITERIRSAILDENQHFIEQDIYLGEDITKPTFGVQVGLRLIHSGVPINFEEPINRAKEEYVQRHPQKNEEGISPVHLPARQMFANKARIGIGVRSDNRCYVVMIEGCDSRTFFPEYDSAGGNTDDLTRHFLGLGCHDAVALDGGGSAQIAFRGKTMVRLSDRYDVPMVPAERLIPGAWMVFG